MQEIDWSTFDDLPESECECRCGAIFRSHTKGIYRDRVLAISRKPCPSCGRNNNLRRVSSDPESFTIGRR